MLTKALHDAGLRSWQLHGASLGAIGLCIGLWIRAKTVDQDERGNAERRALFVGLWPPMFWLIGDSVQAHESGPALRRGGYSRVRMMRKRTMRRAPLRRECRGWAGCSGHLPRRMRPGGLGLGPPRAAGGAPR